MLSSQKKKITLILVAIMISSIFAEFMFGVKQFSIKVIVSYGPGAVYDSEVKVTDNNSLIEALSMALGGVSLNGTEIACVNSLCTKPGSNWTVFNSESVINADYKLKPGETIYLIYLSNETNNLIEEQEINYDAIRKLLKLDS